MKPDFYFKIFFPCLFGLMAFFFLAVGLSGIIGRRPFLISGRWLFAAIVLGYAPSLLHPFVFASPLKGDESGLVRWIPWVDFVLFGVVAIVMGFAARGYQAFAVSNSSFRAGLLASLKRLDLPHEEKLSSLHLPSVGADLQVSVQSGLGIGQIRVKQRQFKGLLRDIVGGMNEYYRASTVPPNLVFCNLSLVLGVFLLGLAGAFLIGLEF